MSLRPRHLPNVITFSRLLLAVAAFWFLDRLLRVQEPGAAHRAAAHLAFWFYLAASITDALDGWVARRYGWTSALGRVADPVVDKVLTLGALVYISQIPFLTLPGDRDLLGRVMPAWAVVLILSREFLVTAVRGMVESQGLRFPADRLGKLKMTLQTVYICILVGAAGQVPARLHVPFLLWLREPWLVFFLFWAVVGLTLASGVNYSIRAVRMLSGGTER